MERTLNEIAKTAIIESGLRQFEVAKLTGKSKPVINILKGIYKVTLPLCAHILESLGLGGTFETTIIYKGKKVKIIE